MAQGVEEVGPWGRQGQGQRDEAFAWETDGDGEEGQRGKQGQQEEDGEGVDESEAVGSCEVEMDEISG